MIPAPQVSIYSTARDNVGAATSLMEVLDGIRNGRWRKEIEAIRQVKAQGDAAAYREKKVALLPGATISGLFRPTRAKDRLEVHSGYVVLDFDHVDRPAELRGLAQDSPSTLTAFVSPGGDGVKVVVAVSPVPVSAAEHEAAWRTADATYAEVLSQQSDAACKDVCRLTFVAFDEDMRVAETTVGVPWSAVAAPPAPQKTALPSTGQERLRAALDKHPEDLRAMAYIKPPPEYHRWLGWVITFKSLGFSAAEVESWASQGHGYKQGEIETRWALLPVNEEYKARNKLRGAAYKLEWRPSGGLDATATVAADVTASQHGLFRMRGAENIHEKMQLLGYDTRFNLRADRAEMYLPAADEWAVSNERVEGALRELIASTFTYVAKNGDPTPLEISAGMMRDRLTTLCASREVDPFLEWLYSLPAWDRTPRLDSWLGELLTQAEHTDDGLLSWATKYLLLACVARAHEPGYKLDNTPVIIGPPGIGKSTLLAWLLPPERRSEWFCDTFQASTDMKKMVEASQGRVLVEMAEMVGYNRADFNSVASFLSSGDSSGIRLTWRRDPDPLPKRYVLAGTANRDNFEIPNVQMLARRLVPIHFTGGDPYAIRGYLDMNRTQLWAEALHYRQTGVGPVLPAKLKEAHEAAAERSRASDDKHEGAIRNFALEPAEAHCSCGLRSELTLTELGQHCLPPAAGKTWGDWLSIAEQERRVWLRALKAVGYARGTRWSADQKRNLRVWSHACNP